LLSSANRAAQVSEQRIALNLERSRAGGVEIVDVVVRSGPLQGQRARIIPTNPSSAYFYEEPSGKPSRSMPRGSPQDTVLAGRRAEG
jgi:hypothetical protein